VLIAFLYCFSVLVVLGTSLAASVSAWLVDSLHDDLLDYCSTWEASLFTLYRYRPCDLLLLVYNSVIQKCRGEEINNCEQALCFIIFLNSDHCFIYLTLFMLIFIWTLNLEVSFISVKQDINLL